MPGVDGNAKRETSGRGGSILMTSAPRSSRVRAQSGPASTREKSTTRMPESGPLISAPGEFGEAGTVVAERGQPDLEVLGGPDWLLDFGHRFVGRERASKFPWRAWRRRAAPGAGCRQATDATPARPRPSRFWLNWPRQCSRRRALIRTRR